MDDVVVGSWEVSTSAAVVSFFPAAVHQVLWAKGDEHTGSLLHLTLESSQSAEGPAGPTLPLQKERNPLYCSVFLSFK